MSERPPFVRSLFAGLLVLAALITVSVLACLFFALTEAKADERPKGKGWWVLVERPHPFETLPPGATMVFCTNVAIRGFWRCHIRFDEKPKPAPKKGALPV